MSYSAERKEAVIKKMLPPHNKSISQLSKEEGISEQTLYTWRREARKQAHFLPASGSSPESWTSKDRFAAVVETAAMNEVEIAAYCRRRGLYPEHLQSWREACEQATELSNERQNADKKSARADKKRIKELERELARKEKALAETAALLTLRKKAQAIWGDEEE